MREDRFAKAVVDLVRLQELMDREAEWEEKYHTAGEFYKGMRMGRELSLEQCRAELRSAFEQMMEPS